MRTPLYATVACCSKRSQQHLLGNLLLGIHFWGIFSAAPYVRCGRQQPRIGSNAAGLVGFFSCPEIFSLRSRNLRFAFQKIKQKNPQPETWAVDKVVDKVFHRCCCCAVDNRECVARRYPQGLWIVTGGADALSLPRCGLLLSLYAYPSANRWYERYAHKSRPCTNQSCAQDFSLGLTPTRRMLRAS